MVELIPAVCPQCGGKLEVPVHLERAYCVYCGTQIIIERKVEKHLHYHVRQATFTCEVCRREKTLREYSGVNGRSICMDCYNWAENLGFAFWIIGILVFFLGLGLMSIWFNDDNTIIWGFTIIITGVVLSSVGRLISYG